MGRKRVKTKKRKFKKANKTYKKKAKIKRPKTKRRVKRRVTKRRIKRKSLKKDTSKGAIKKKTKSIYAVGEWPEGVACQNCGYVETGKVSKSNCVICKEMGVPSVMHRSISTSILNKSCMGRLDKWKHNGNPLYFMDSIYDPSNKNDRIGKLCFYHALKEGHVKQIPKDINPTEFYTPKLEDLHITIRRFIETNSEACKKDKELIEEQKAKDRVKASVKIQAANRGRKARKTAKKMRDEKKYREELAISQEKEAIKQGYQSFVEKNTWENTFSHKKLFKKDVVEEYDLSSRLLDQFSEDFKTNGGYDVYKTKLDYKSLLELFESCTGISGGGESKVLFTKSKQTSSKLVNIKQYLNLHSNDIVLLYKETEKFQFYFDKDEISKANAVSSLMFPGYVGHMGCISAPQPIIFEKHGIINKPVIYEILANEGPETDIGPWNNILDKSTLQWFQTIVFRLYVYNCGILRQEDKFRNWTIYEPNQGDLYVFILKSNDKCLSYMCNVKSGDKFVKAIDIDSYNQGSKKFMKRGQDTKNIIQKLGKKDSEDTLPISKQVKDGITFELYCSGLEEVFNMAKEQSRDQIDDSPVTHTYVLDADLLFNGESNIPFTTFYSPDYTEDELQLLIEYKPLIQILMLLNKYNVDIDWTDDGLQVLIELLPDEIKQRVKDMLEKDEFNYDDIVNDLPDFITSYINTCQGTSEFKSS